MRGVFATCAEQVSAADSRAQSYDTAPSADLLMLYKSAFAVGVWYFGDVKITKRLNGWSVEGSSNRVSHVVFDYVIGTKQAAHRRPLGQVLKMSAKPRLPWIIDIEQHKDGQYLYITFSQARVCLILQPKYKMKSLFRPFPLPLTPRQWFYLIFLQGVGAGFIDGGINFAIAFAMYHSQHDVKMWVFKHNTIAGDLGVTPIITCAVSMLITSTLVHSDLHHHAIGPLPFVYPHVEHLPDPRQLYDPSLRSSTTKQHSKGEGSGDILDDPTADTPRPELRWDKGGFRFFFWMLIRFIFEGTEKNILLARIPISEWFGRLAWTAAQGAGIGIIFGFPLWCLAIVILGPIYGNGNLGGKWAPQAIKLVYGALVGWVTNPVIATLALGSQAEHHLLVVEHDVEEGATTSATATTMDNAGAAAAGTTSVQRPDTIQEEDGPDNASPAHLQVPPLTPTVQRQTMPSSNSFLSLPSPRSRGASTSSLTRPPLTANVSSLTPLPLPDSDAHASTSSTSPRLPQTPRALRLRSNTASSNGAIPHSDSGSGPGAGKLPRQTSEPVFRLGRIRSISVTGPLPPQPTPSVTSTSTSTQFSYALGGAGGRAQRPRASTRASASRGLAGPSTAPLRLDSDRTLRSGVTSPPASAPLLEKQDVRDVSGTGGS